MKNIVKLTVLGALMVAAAGCTDLKPLQTEIDSLKTQVATLQSGLAAHIADQRDARAAAKAEADAQAAGQSAAAAQNTANQALKAAQAAQASVDATNDKIDRMFRKSVSK